MCVYALWVRLSWQHNNNVFRFKPALFCITFYKHWGIECTVNQHYFYSLHIILVTCSSLFKFSIEFPQYFMTLLLCLFNFYVWFSQKKRCCKNKCACHAGKDEKCIIYTSISTENLQLLHIFLFSYFRNIFSYFCTSVRHTWRDFH